MAEGMKTYTPASVGVLFSAGLIFPLHLGFTQEHIHHK